MTTFTFDAIGTSWQIDIYKTIPDTEKSELFLAIQKRITEFDKTYSRFRDDSLVMNIARESGKFIFPEDSKKIFELYYDLYNLTDGFFTPFVGQILSDAGYDAQYSLKQKRELQNPPLWESVIDFDYPTLVAKEPVLLDFGAGGKGYLVDIVAEVIEKYGIFEYVIDAGGDIVHKGSVPINIGLEHPQNFDQAIGIYNLSNGSLCGSAGNRRVWGNFTHIINPATLESPKNILGVWVFAKNALLADSLATCLFFVSAHKLLKKYDFEYLVMYDDMHIEKSHNFSAEIFHETK
ncbi:MAG: FAD:protein FMN transferase [bacterium]